MAFTFTINGHEYTSDPANTTALDGYRFVGYGYIPALGNLVADVVVVAGQAVTAALSAGHDADDAQLSEIAATAAAVAAGASAAAAANSATGLIGSSATNLLPAVAVRNFVTQAGKQFPLNHYMLAVSAANPAIWMYGQVNSYAGTALQLNVLAIGTATAAADWVLAITGIQGIQGIQGLPGADAILLSPTVTSAGTRSAVYGDAGKTINLSGITTLNPDTAAALGDGWEVKLLGGASVCTITGVATLNVGQNAILRSNGTTLTLIPLGSVEQVIYVRDEKPAATGPGAGATGAWTDRVLNTVVLNEIAGASLASNAVTLPAGTYEFEGNSPFHTCFNGRAELRNVTDNTSVYGPNVYAADNSGTSARVSGKFQISASKTFKLRYYQTNPAAPGNVANTSPAPEVYAELKFRKVA